MWRRLVYCRMVCKKTALRRLCIRRRAAQKLERTALGQNQHTSKHISIQYSQDARSPNNSPFCQIYSPHNHHMWHEHNLRWNPHILPGARNSALHPVGRVAEVIAPLPHLQVSADIVDEEQEWPGWGQHSDLNCCGWICGWRWVPVGGSVGYQVSAIHRGIR